MPKQNGRVLKQLVIVDNLNDDETPDTNFSPLSKEITNKLTLGIQQTLRIGIQNGLKIYPISTPDPHMSFQRLPQSPRVPPDPKNGPTSAKTQAPGLPNHSSGHRKWLRFPSREIKRCFAS